MIKILAPEELEGMLMRKWCLCLAECPESCPCVVRNTYGNDGQTDFGFTGPGRKLEMMQSVPHVALLVYEIAGSAQWRLVIVEGLFDQQKSPEALKQGSAANTRSERHLVTRGLTAESNWSSAASVRW